MASQIRRQRSPLLAQVRLTDPEIETIEGTAANASGRIGVNCVSEIEKVKTASDNLTVIT